MELKDFISKSLTEICEGVMEARDLMISKIDNCPIAPASVSNSKDRILLEQYIEFNVEVVVSTEGTLTAKAGGAAILMRGEGSSTEKNLSSHNIKFAIPFYPAALCKNPNSPKV